MIGAILAALLCAAPEEEIRPYTAKMHITSKATVAIAARRRGLSVVVRISDLPAFLSLSPFGISLWWRGQRREMPFGGAILPTSLARRRFTDHRQPGQ